MLCEIEEEILAVESVMTGLRRWLRSADAPSHDTRSKIEQVVAVGRAKLKELNTAKDKFEKSIAGELAEENRELQKIAKAIEADSEAFHGAVSAGLVMPDFRTIDLSSLKRFIEEAQQAGALPASTDLINIAGQVVAEIKKWR